MLISHPSFHNVFRSLSRPIESTRAVIFGQDPYPTKGHAHGLAFSVDQSVSTLPPSLRNILTELSSDLGVLRKSGDLSDWFDQGVLLVNRVLTTANRIFAGALQLWLAGSNRCRRTGTRSTRCCCNSMGKECRGVVSLLSS